MIVRNRVQVIHDVEARPVLPPREFLVVDGGQVHEHVEPELGIAPTVGEGIDNALARHHQRVIAEPLVRIEGARAQAGAQPRENGRSVHGKA